jgi:hypothetical protein
MQIRAMCVLDSFRLLSKVELEQNAIEGRKKGKKKEMYMVNLLSFCLENWPCLTVFKQQVSRLLHSFRATTKACLRAA